MKGFIHFSLAALAASVSAVSVNLNKRESPLGIYLSKSGNTEVKVAVTNYGHKTLNLLSKGTFLDEVNPVEKVSVFSNRGGTKVPFEGIKIRLLTTGLSPNDFLTLGPHETKVVTVETAALHTLNDGGDFEVFAKGLLPFAEANSTELAGNLGYESNKLTMSVDGVVAATVAKAITKRSTVGDTCTGSKRDAINAAHANCANQAFAAAAAAVNGDKLDTYFKSTSSSTRNEVASRLAAVANDCSGMKSTTTTDCNDSYNGCDANVLAYTVPTQNSITYCDIFFSAVPAVASSCHGQDQATTVLHEETHADGVYSPGTDDLGYGFAAASALATTDALNNADTYALYANAIHLKC